MGLVEHARNSPAPRAKGDVPGRQLFYEFIQSILHNLVDQHHGGSLLIVPNEFNVGDVRLDDLINIKYAVSDNRVWQKLEAFAQAEGDRTSLKKTTLDGDPTVNKGETDDAKALQTLDRKMMEIRDAVFDIAKFIALLADVDGAVVVTHRMRLLGFGAEIVADSRSLRDVKVWGSEPGQSRRIEEYGTRHRSAFRICSRCADILAFVVSSDGGLRACMRTGPDVHIWEEVATTY